MLSSRITALQNLHYTRCFDPYSLRTGLDDDGQRAEERLFASFLPIRGDSIMRESLTDYLARIAASSAPPTAPGWRARIARALHGVTGAPAFAACAVLYERLLTRRPPPALLRARRDRHILFGVTSDAPAVSLRSLSKHYGQVRAVDGISLEVRTGEVFGFLGLNGAGKSTTIRILLDLLRPTAGRAEVFGIDCQRNSHLARAKMGYLPGELGLQTEMTGAQLLRLASRLSASPVDARYQRTLATRLELSEGDLGRPLRQYSSGMKRKLGLIQALQADPPLIILDEPTEGLDPLVQRALYELLFELRAKGRTIFLSSHVLTHVERLCDRVAVIRKGTIALVDTIDELRRRGRRTVRVHFAEPVPALELPDGISAIEQTDTRWTLAVERTLGPLLRRLAALPVTDMDVAEPALEDILRGYYREDGA
jgi:ABC-2 type transport system ATP-binding protein